MTLDGLFELGEIITTPAARRVLASFSEDFDQVAGRILARHHNGDWGDVSQHESDQNDRNVVLGKQIASAYGRSSMRLYVITAADRSTTVIKTPREVDE